MRATSAALGISSDDTVVAYDAGNWVAAPRAWWMFCRSAIAMCKVLDGGLKKWRAEGRALQFRRGHAESREIQGQARPGVRPEQGATGRQSGARGEQLIDARPRARFEGSVAEPRPGLRSGHIPGSRNVPYAELFDAKTGAMKPLDELRKAFAGAGVDMSDRS